MKAGKLLLILSLAVTFVTVFANFVFAESALYQRFEPNSTSTVGEFLFDDDYIATTTPACNITIRDTSGSVWVNNASMSTSSDGWYSYTFYTSSTLGFYRGIMTCGTSTDSSLISTDKSFFVGPTFYSTTTIVETIWSYTGSTLDTANNAIAKVWSYAARKLTSRQIATSSEYIAGVTTSTAIAQVAEKSVVDAIEYDVDLIRGVTFDFSGFADVGSSSSTLVDSELTHPDDYWNNYRLIMMSGSNFGEERTVSDFVASTDTITVSSPFTNAISASDKYVLFHEDRLVYQIWNYSTRTLTSFGTLVTDIWSNASRTMTAFGSLAADVWNNTYAPTRGLSTSTLTSGSLATLTNLNTLESNIRGASSTDLTTLAGYVDSVEGYIGIPTDTATSTLFGAIKDVRTKLDQLDTLETKINTLDTVVDLIRASQLLGYNLELSDIGEIVETKNYRAKLVITDYESNPVDASSTPSIVLYDALRATATSTTMTKLSTGVYEFVYTVVSGAANGTWETLVSVDLGGSANVQLNDYWEVEGSPAQVVINSMSDTTVPSISANTTISNEGSTGYEYQYEYCVVSTEANQCGGGDDVAYANAAKYLNAGQDWTTDLGLTVSNTGDYWFKVVVYWGSETSGASRTFTAGEEPAPEAPSGGGVTVGVSLNTIYSKLLEVQEELGYHAIPSQNLGTSVYETLRAMAGDLETVAGVEGCGLCNIFKLEQEQANDIDYLKNKLSELRALLDVNKLLIDKAANKPVIKTWFEWGSVVLKMLVINPSVSQSQIIPFEAYLPREVKPEHIIDRGDLILDFDEENNLWYVHKEIRLAAGESATKRVEIKDIWIVHEEDIDSLRNQFEELIKPLEKTAFFAQAVTLKSDADRLLDGIIRKQNEYKATPQEHIIAYRENQESLNAIESNLEALQKLVAEESGASRAIGSLFGVSTTMTWAIVIIVIVGIAVLMIMLYIMLLRHQDLEYHLAGEEGLQKNPQRGLRHSLIRQTSKIHSHFSTVTLKVIIRFLIIIGILSLLIWLLIKFTPGF
ncbi:MAG: hypothetical protein V3T98_00950 [Candidatus Paceibacterota bacterium]